MTLCPQKEDTGIFFERTDMPGRPRIAANAAHVFDTSRSTNLCVADARVYTVEHVLAACRAYSIDNLGIELSGIEPPAGNGSSDVFVELIEQAGIKQQKKDIPIFELEAPVYWSQGEIHLVALPSKEYRISYTLSYPHVPALGTQFYSVEVTPAHFKSEIAPCRTFALYEELAYLMDRGLIKGGSLDNAVVIKEDAIICKNGLFFPNEMVRHKILDMIGDLSLVGKHFLAHIIAIRSGHTSNVAFAKELQLCLNK